MPAKWFKCPDDENVKIKECMKKCRMGSRCATLPYLRLIGFDREFTGKISPSNAGSGPLAIFLKGTRNYVVKPEDRVWASIGIGTHAKLSLNHYSDNVLSEEKLSDEKMRGIADVLEMNENGNDLYNLWDYKTWGSFKVAKAIGMITNKTKVVIMDDQGNPVFLKSGENKGKPKTKTETIFEIDHAKIDLRSEELQLNRYRIFFESKGFKIAEIGIMAIPRDGGTWIAESRGITKNIYLIPIRRVQDDVVLQYYDSLQRQVKKALLSGKSRLCDSWECWEGRMCEGYCEVSDICSHEFGRPEKWKGSSYDNESRS